MQTNLKFYDTLGDSNNLKIPKSALASTKTSIDLVLESDYDSFYFRRLEAQDIFLNKNQIEAVRHVNGPLLTLAGAGSGKTNVLISRVGYLLTVKKEMVRPENMMIFTFSRKASNEMNERLLQLPGIGKQHINKITAGTFHSIFLRLLRSNGHNQEILSNEKYKRTIIEIILKEMGIKDSHQPEILLATLSFYKVNMTTYRELPDRTDLEKEIKTILTKFEEWKKTNNYLDFDDILLEAYYLLKSNNSLLEKLQNRFSYISIDEFQDTNPISYELIKLIAKPQNNLFVVGDDDQAIYSFNGSNNKFILEFDKDFTNTKIITLDINYRSNTNIVGLGNEIIKRNKERRKKTLKAIEESNFNPKYIRPDTTDDEARIIVDYITKDIEENNRRYSDYLILYRTASSSRAIFEELVLRDVPFISFDENITFYENSTVKPIIEFLRLAFDPSNMQIINNIMPTLFLPREKTMEYIQRQQYIDQRDEPIFHIISLPSLKPFHKKQIMDQLSILNKVPKLIPLEAIKELRKHYDKYLKTTKNSTITLNKEIMLENLDELEVSSSRFKTVLEFLSFIDRFNGKKKEIVELHKNNNLNAISLMTVHKAKGLEFPYVFIIGASETILPHKSALEASGLDDIISNKSGWEKVEQAIEEERRLMYVAVTRAEKEVYISSPSKYRGKNVKISRFLQDAFGDNKVLIKTKNHNIIKASEKQNKKPNIENVLAWICNNDECNAWKRILTHEETLEEERQCPLCNSKMKKGNI